MADTRQTGEQALCKYVTPDLNTVSTQNLTESVILGLDVIKQFLVLSLLVIFFFLLMVGCREDKFSQ